MDINLKIKTHPIIKNVKKNNTISPTIYSPASVVDNINKITHSSKSNKKIWKKSKLSNINQCF